MVAVMVRVIPPFSSDAAATLGVLDQVACYTQFSGRPSADQLYEFTKTVISLMTDEERQPKGKALIVSSNVSDFITMVKLQSGSTMVRT